MKDPMKSVKFLQNNGYEIKSIIDRLPRLFLRPYLKDRIMYIKFSQKFLKHNFKNPQMNKEKFIDGVFSRFSDLILLIKNKNHIFRNSLRELFEDNVFSKEDFKNSV